MIPAETLAAPDAATPRRSPIRPVRRRSRWRWRLRWGRPLPWPTRVEIIATLGLWLAGTWGWNHMHADGPPPPRPAARALPQPIPVPADGMTADATRLLVTSAHPDAGGFYPYQQDRLEVRVPVSLRQIVRDESQPELTSARGQRPGLRFELNRVFDFRARVASTADLAHGFAARICRAAGAELVHAEDTPCEVNGQPALRTVMETRLGDGRRLTVEGLTIDEGVVAWSLWAGYPAEDKVSRAAVRQSFDSAALRPLRGTGGVGGVVAAR